MKMKKMIIFLSILFICLSISTIVLATGVNYKKENVFFSQGKSFQTTQDGLGPSIEVTTNASEKVGNPVINVRAQGKAGLFFDSGAYYDVTITSINRDFYAFFDRPEAGTTRITWKQTNDNASMNATLGIKG